MIIMDTTLEDVYNVVAKWLGKIDTNRIDTILATVLSNQLTGTPIWMLFVGASGDSKTELIRSLIGLPHVIEVDQLTTNTLASGKKGATDLGAELAHASKILLFTDLASLTSMKTDEKNQIWGQLRTLYDGFINKRTGSGVRKKYDNCHVTLIGCTTGAIRDEILIHAQLGTRELMYDTNSDPTDNNAKMEKAIENEKFESEMRKDLRDVVHKYLQCHKVKDIPLTEEMKEFLKAEASRLSILRATGSIDWTSRELLSPVSPEVPTRLIKQFVRIVRCLKSLDEHYPDEKVKEIIRHIVNSSGNKVRQMILSTLEDKSLDWFAIREVQSQTKLGRNTVKQQLEILWNLDVIEKEVREERIGGHSEVVTDEDGPHVKISGGKVENVAYYRFKRLP